jgi:hypothetical protein
MRKVAISQTELKIKQHFINLQKEVAQSLIKNKAVTMTPSKVPKKLRSPLGSPLL